MNTIFTSKPLRSLVAIAVVGAVSTGFAAVSAAGGFTEVRTVTVQYGDLNLANPQGAAALYNRIVRAARDVCDRQDSNLAARHAARVCIDKAIADAVTMVGHPELVAVYTAKTHRSLPTTVASTR